MTMSDSESLASIENEETQAFEELVIVPSKSRERYEITYKKYENWCNSTGFADLTNEKALLTFFNESSKDHKPTTLWSTYSMLRATLSVNNNFDISKYSNLLAFLKKTAVGYKPRKTKTFDRDNVTKFLLEASDDKFLFTKVAFIIGLSGACKKNELTELRSENVKDKGSYFYFFLPNKKPKVSRDFVVTSGDIEGINFVDLVRKYALLRPKNMNHNRFFIQFKNGICTKQPVGRNTFGTLPQKIATFLKLENPSLYTSHCLRRSSSSLLTDVGANIYTMKSLENSKSNTIMESYIESSMENKCEIFKHLLENAANENDSMPNEAGNKQEKAKEDNEITEFDVVNICETSQELEEPSEPSSSSSRKSRKGKRCKDFENTYSMVENAINTIKSKDEFTAFGQYVGSAVRSLNNRDLQSWARYQINNVLYEAECKMNMLSDYH